MARGPCTYRQRDLTCALKAAVAAGIEVSSFEIGKDGNIIVKAKALEQADEAVSGPNPWDKVISENA